MITLEAANLAITLVKGIIKLTRSVDLVLAEKAAVEAPIALPAPNLALGPSFNQMRKGLLGLLDRPLDAAGDPLGGDRKPIRELLAGSPEAADMEPWVKKYLPELALGTLVDLNKEFVTVLRETRPDWAADPDILLAAFHVGAGADFRNKGYPWRLALTVVDVLAELGAENAPKFVRDPGLQSLVGEVLKRFADADLQKADSTGELVRGVLAATLNGVVDARGTLGLKQEWLTGLLDALSAAREKAASPDNFILGLVQGQGYPLLVGATLDLAAGKLADGQAPAFRKTAATFLGQVAELVRSQPSFEGFFKEHWSGLLRAGLDSVAQHGPALLAGNEPLLGQVLSAVAANLARQPANKILTTGTLAGVVQAAASAVASHPGRVDELLGEPWLSALLKSAAGTLAAVQQGEIFSPVAVERMLRDAMLTFGRQPELIIQRAGLAQELVGDVLEAVAKVPGFSAEALAQAVVGASLETIAQHPGLLDTDYAKLVAALAGQAAKLVQAKQLTALQAQDLVRVVIATLAENPELLANLQTNLVATVVGSVTRLAGDKQFGPLSGATVVQVVKQVLQALASAGKAALANRTADAFAAELDELLKAGLKRAAAELGHRLTTSVIPAVMGRLVVAWSQGPIGPLDAGDSSFQLLFAGLSNSLLTANS